MSILKEAIEYLFERGKESKQRSILQFPNDPDKSFVIGPDLSMEIATPRQQPIRAEICHTVEDFAQCLEERSADLESQVWYDEHQAVAYASDMLRRSTVTIPFASHPILETVKKLASIKMFEQKQVIRFLRIDLGGMVDPEVVSHFRQLQWDSVRRVKQTIEHSRSSLDQDIQASVKSQDADAPEQFPIRIPLFADMRYRETTFDTLIAVELDTDSSKIGLTLFPGTLEAIVMKQREAVHNFLSQHVDEKEFTLVCGSSGINAAR